MPTHACVKNSESLTCHKAAQPSVVPNFTGTPSVYRESKFFQAKFCLAKKYCTILKLLSMFVVSKRGSRNGISLMARHAHNKQNQALAALKCVIGCVEEAGVTAPRSAMKHKVHVSRSVEQHII